MADLFTEVIKKFSNYKDPAGVAAATAGIKTIKEALDSTDPGRISQILPQFATQIQQIINTMGIISMGSSAASSTPPTINSISNTANIVTSNLYSTSNVVAVSNTSVANTSLGCRVTMSVSEVMQIGLTNALAMESQKNGLHKTMGVMASVLNNPQYFSLLSYDYQIIMISAFKSFEYNLHRYGLSSFPILTAPPIIVGNVVPSPIVTVVPDFYAQIFYDYNVDPYPGYVQYQSIVDFSNSVYTIRTSAFPPFPNAKDEFIYTAENAFMTELDPYIIQANLSVSALALIMTDVLNQVLTVWHNVLFGTGSQSPVLTGNTTVISNTTSTSASSSSSLVAQLLPWLQSMIQNADSNHLSNSVLNKQAIQQLLNKHGDMCAKMKMCQLFGQVALQLGAGGNGPTSDFG